jgi:hypothetical protein
MNRTLAVQPLAHHCTDWAIPVREFHGGWSAIEAGFSLNALGFPILIIILPLLHSQISVRHNPDEAAHYHWVQGLISPTQHLAELSCLDKIIIKDWHENRSFSSCKTCLLTALFTKAVRDKPVQILSQISMFQLSS